MPIVIRPLISGHRPMAGMCYDGRCLLLQTLEALTGALDALDSEVSGRLKMSFSLGHLGHLSKTPTVTKASVACVSFHHLLASYPHALTSQVHTLPWPDESLCWLVFFVSLTQSGII